VTPLSTNFRGYDVFEIGPQTQGIAALEMLNILEGFDLKSLGHNSAEYLHLLIEAKKLAFADRDAYVADPDRASVPVTRLLSKEYAASRRNRIDRAIAAPATMPGLAEHGETVYLSVVDKDRNAVSFINSIFGYFGSGLLAGDTGIVLQNRGSLFELDSRHPNVIAPRKRPFHTLIPGMLLKGGKPFYSFGVMGGDMQPQGHAQVILNVVEFGMDAQQAGDSPRFRHWAQGVALESAFDGTVRYGLTKKGHSVIGGVDCFGGYQGIVIDPKSGALVGGSDVRKDGLAIGW
jgi:gamma-glutamyltranspeptidase/glutathione hydrolase